MKIARSAFAAGLLLTLPNIALTSSLAAQEASEATIEAAAHRPIWPFENSDLPVDPSFTFGRLDNGMRYILRQNATPEGTALVRMRIDSGSLDETDEERGLSHYLEHMAFNGSTNIPEGEMIKLLEREGLAFGADTNASTGFSAITYVLNLPRNDEELLDTALMLMRETASELTIAEDAVERERGVILAERRDRRGFQQRAQEDSFDFIAPGARFAERLPIGALEVLENTTAAQLRALYERTYTPENTVLVIVGDYPVEVMEAAIRARFADWQGGAAPQDPVTGPVDITREGETDIYLDPALSESVSISAMGEWLDRPDTIANRQTALLRTIGYGIISRRMTRLARGEDAPFRGAGFGTGNVFEDARSTGLSIASVDGEWRRGVLAAVRELNQALTFGFTDAEVNEQIQNIRTGNENAVGGYDTRSNAQFVGAALSLVSDDRIPTHPETALARFETLVPSITPESVLEALLAHVVPLENPLIRFTGRTAPEGGEEALRAAFAEGMALAIAPPEETGAVEFAYTDFGEPGQIASDTRDDRLDMRFITFANGVRLTLKHTDTREDRVLYRMRVDGGRLMNTREDPLRTYLVASLTAGGLGQHSVDDLQSVLAGRSVGLSVSNSADGINFNGGTTPRDLELQMQLLAAGLTDPGYRAEGIAQFRRGIDNFYETLRATPGRAYSNAAGAILSDNDPRFSLSSKEDFYALDYDKLEAAIGDRLENGAIELAIVGDIDEEATITAVASTIGALPRREADFRPRSEARSRTFTQMRGEQILRHEGEADQALVRLVWPTDDDDDFAEEMQVSLLARVVRLELTDRLREELGQAYSPSASSSMSRIYPDYGTFTISTSVDVAEVEAARAAIVQMIEDLRTTPVSEDTLQRARQPLLEAFENALKSPAGWMSLADRAQSEADRLQRWFDGPDAIRSVTPEEVQAAAQKFLTLENAVQFIVLPEESSEDGQATDG